MCIQMRLLIWAALSEFTLFANSTIFMFGIFSVKWLFNVLNLDDHVNIKPRITVVSQSF